MSWWVEAIGYAASVLIVASLAMSSVVRLRIISLIGSITFVAYGAFIGAWPVIISNIIIAGINVWYLVKEFTRQRSLGAVPIAPDTPYLLDFLRSHADEIARNQPVFTGVKEDSVAWLLTRDGLPAGAVVGRRDGATLHLELDHVLPAYRDTQLGQWLYGRGASVLTSSGVQTVVAPVTGGSHDRYLTHIGFRRDGDRLVKEL